MGWTIEVSAAVEQDIALLFDHLAENYINFGESRASAVTHATRRTEEVLAAMTRIAMAPHRGESHEDLLPGLRHLTLQRAIYWYQIDDDHQIIRILAIFHGGQDHIRHMLLRLLRDRNT